MDFRVVAIFALRGNKRSGSGPFEVEGPMFSRRKVVF